MVNKKILTRNMGGSLKLGCHLRVHGDHDFLFVIHDGVPMLDLFVDPLLEALSEDGRADVHQPLLRNFGQINVIREVIVNHVQIAHEFKNLFDRQVLVLRHVQSFDLVILHVSFSPGNYVLQKVNRDVLYMDHSVKGHELEHLP